MKKEELKKMLKPLIKECVREAIIEEGLLTEVVSQVAAGLHSTSPALPAPQTPARQNAEKDLVREDLQMKRKAREASKKLQEHRKKLLQAVGNDAYNGVDLFEGTKPLSSSEAGGTPSAASSLGEDPTDAGVDLSSILGNASQIWSALK